MNKTDLDHLNQDSSSHNSKHDTRSRKYLLTCNNPENFGVTHDSIKNTLHSEFKSLKYYCMAFEVASTRHIHVFVHFSSQVRFSQIKKHFPNFHIDSANGSISNNRDYVFKIGKWSDTEKATTSLPETRFEWGEYTDDSKKQSSKLAQVYQMIKEGYTTESILETVPENFIHTDRIERARQMLKHSQNRHKYRNVFCVYIYGATGTGKTSLVMETNDIDDIYRTNEYQHPFDSYSSESVIVFDEYRSSLPISEMLQYLDIYPTVLKARYSPKQACFEKVYIISNEGLSFQYPDTQLSKPATWKAFLRRIHLVINFDEFTAKYPDIHDRIEAVHRLIEVKYYEHLKKWDDEQRIRQERKNQRREASMNSNDEETQDSSKPLISLEELLNLNTTKKEETQ